jgi:hypothetical protein
MKRTGALPALSLTVGLVMASTPLFAHHGRAGTYTGSKPITSKVTVIRFDYKNPHVRVYFQTKDDAGNAKLWNGEMANISQFVRAGWTKARMVEQLPPGAEMTFTYLPAVSQTHSGEGQDSIVMKIVSTKGEVIGLVRAGAAEALAP